MLTGMDASCAGDQAAKQYCLAKSIRRKAPKDQGRDRRHLACHPTRLHRKESRAIGRRYKGTVTEAIPSPR